MAEINIAGILRAGIYSPNHIGNDAAIFNLVAEHLRKRGCIVNTYSEEQFATADIDCGVIINMCRDPKSILKLQKLEDAGALVINSGYGIENCTRERMTRILVGSGIPYPESVIARTNENILEELDNRGFGKCWIKRADRHSIHKEDIACCRRPEEAQEVLQEFFMRGITKAVIGRHLEGELLKFYGVRDTPFFHFYTNFSSHRGPGLPEVNQAGNPRFDAEAFRRACHKAADAMDIIVYGGDCIVAEDGTFKIIDFNDWPSFAPIRTEVAPVIARRVLSAIKDRR